jgi:hypothetical protein
LDHGIGGAQAIRGGFDSPLMRSRCGDGRRSGAEHAEVARLLSGSPSPLRVDVFKLRRAQIVNRLCPR